MSELPDELWRRILEMGVKINTNPLNFRDVCCIAISCKRFRRIADENSLWSSLLSTDFRLCVTNNNTSSFSPKSLYKSWYEKDKARRIADHRRAVLRIESQIAEYSRSLEELLMRRVEETAKLKAAAAELSNLHKVREASVALNVWQPEVIRRRQKEIIEQCAVPVDSRINALQMELKLCKQHVRVFEKNYRDEKRRLEEAKELLMSMKYHPLHGISVERRVGDSRVKRKKLKLHITADDEQGLKL